MRKALYDQESVKISSDSDPILKENQQTIFWATRYEFESYKQINEKHKLHWNIVLHI